MWFGKVAWLCQPNIVLIYTEPNMDGLTEGMDRVWEGNTKNFLGLFSLRPYHPSSDQHRESAGNHSRLLSGMITSAPIEAIQI